MDNGMQQEITTSLEEEVLGKYGDILELAPPELTGHPRMSIQDRAAQFAPFAALNGHKEAIDETARQMEAEMNSDLHY